MQYLKDWDQPTRPVTVEQISGQNDYPLNNFPVVNVFSTVNQHHSTPWFDYIKKFSRKKSPQTLRTVTADRRVPEGHGGERPGERRPGEDSPHRVQPRRARRRVRRLRVEEHQQDHG